MGISARSALRLLLLLEEGMIARFTLLSMRRVARLYVIDELFDRHVSEVRVGVEHDKVLHHFIERLFFALEKAGFDSAERLLVKLPDVKRCRLEQALGLRGVLLADLLWAVR